MVNDNFKEIPESEWFELNESQVCVVVLEVEKFLQDTLRNLKENPKLLIYKVVMNILMIKNGAEQVEANRVCHIVV